MTAPTIGPRAHRKAVGTRGGAEGTPKQGGEPRVTERDFQSAVIDFLKLHGWMVWHDTASARSPMQTCPNCRHQFKAFRHANAAGLPDLIAVKPGTGPTQGGRLLIYELKTEKGKHKPEQAAWLKALDTVQTFDTGTWRPGDWAEIERLVR